MPSKQMIVPSHLIKSNVPIYLDSPYYIGLDSLQNIDADLVFH